MLAALLTAGITVQGQEVTISWQNDAATVTVSDDILSLVKVKVSGADVSVEQDAWDHVATCDHSFTEERLDWLFSQARSSSSGIKKVEGSKPINDKYFDLSGRQVCSPTRGIYILKCVFVFHFISINYVLNGGKVKP